MKFPFYNVLILLELSPLFHDYDIFDNASELEDEANRFVAEYLLGKNETLDPPKKKATYWYYYPWLFALAVPPITQKDLRR